jgi:hypothetical protein
MRKAIRMTCLHGIWGSDLPRPRDSSQHSHQYISNTVYRQIGAIAARGIVEGEVEILSLLQKQVFGKKGPGRGNMLPETLLYYDNSGRETELYRLA